MSDNWIVQSLEKALNSWDNALVSIQNILTTSPKNYQDGAIWNAIVSVNETLQTIGYGLLVVFFLVGVIKTCGSIAEVKKPEHALKLFIRFILAKAAIGSSLEILSAFMDVAHGIMQTILGTSAITSESAIPAEIITAIEDCGFLDSIPLWIVAFLGRLVVTVIAFVLILTAYGRFFKIYTYIALAPIPMSAFAGEPTQNVGKSFINSFAGACLQGAIIAISCIIFSLYASSPPTVDVDASAVTMAWSYMESLILNMLIMAFTVKASDHVVREMMGL